MPDLGHNETSRTVEGALDDAASSVYAALAVTPAGSWAALVLTNVHEQLISAANHVAAFGIGAEKEGES